uniref:Uncharacterized protein n=1 Tax=Anopheles dirus TaxID=7168 RepID=A0A182NAY3_9DIPT
MGKVMDRRERMEGCLNSLQELLKALKEAVSSLDRGNNNSETAQDDVIVVSQLTNTNLLLLLTQNLNLIDFEGKKDVVQIFNNVLRRKIGTRSSTVEYICTKPEILFTLLAEYEQLALRSARQDRGA